MCSPAVPSGLDGPIGLEEISRFTAAAGNPPLPEALVPSESRLRCGDLDRKIEIIIWGVAVNLSPSAMDMGGKSALGVTSVGGANVQWYPRVRGKVYRAGGDTGSHGH